MEYLSVTDFAALSGLSPATIWRYVSRKALPSVQPGGRKCRVLIPADALQSLLAGRVTAARPSRETADPGRLSGPKPKWLRPTPTHTVGDPANVQKEKE